MEIRAVAELAWPAEAVFGQVRTLDGYPTWLSLVESAVALPSGDQDAWAVSLAAQLGPVRRTKQVRMVRVVDRAPSLARFERIETDGRSHSAWVLTATVQSVGSRPDPASQLTVLLHYGGRLRLPLVETLLRVEAARAGPRLAARLAATAADPGGDGRPGCPRRG